MFWYSIRNQTNFPFSSSSGGSNRQKASETLSNIGIAMSRFLVTGEFKMPEVTYNIGRIGHNIGRVGDTVATDSVVTEDNILNISQEE